MSISQGFHKFPGLWRPGIRKFKFPNDFSGPIVSKGLCPTGRFRCLHAPLFSENIDLMQVLKVL
jgi:hypothetical protein